MEMIVKRLKAFFNGMLEFRSDWTTHYDDDSTEEAYSTGRDLAHKLTLRYWDQS